MGNIIQSLIEEFKANESSLWVSESSLKAAVSPSLKNDATLVQLKKYKQEIIECLQINKINTEKQFRSTQIFKYPRDGVYPLSFAQERLWFFEQYEKGTNAYHIPLLLELASDIEKTRLIEAIQYLITRHEILRTIFHQDDGEYSQIVMDEPAVINEYHHGHFNLDERIHTDVNVPFNLQKEYPIRICFYHYKEQIKLLINVHHIAFDGWSMEQFVSELERVYNGELLPELVVQYKDFSVWQRNYLKGPIFEKQLAYWTGKLQGFSDLSLPTDRRRPRDINYQGDFHLFTIDGNLSTRLRELARENACSMYCLLLAGFYIFLSKYSGQSDLVVGSPVANRHIKETADLIGFFVNSIALREKVDVEESGQDFITRVRDSVREAQKYQDIPFEKVVEGLKIEQNTSKHPVFQTMFGVQSFGNREEGSLFRSLTFVDTHSSTHDLSLFLDDSALDIKGRLSFATALYEKSSIERMARYYVSLLEKIALSPGEKIKSYKFYETAELQKIVVDWNDTAVPYPDESLIHSQFERQAEITPERTALVCGDLTMTYSALNRRSNQLARKIRCLHRERTGRELAANCLVALNLEKGFEMMVAILAVLKAGAAYVPIDVSLPTQKKAHILQDTNAEIVLCLRSDLTEGLDDTTKHKALSIDLSEPFYTEENESNLPIYNTSNDLIYVMYTSGSTGNPKGVQIRHNSVSNLIHFYKNRYLTLGDKLQVALVSNYQFDFSVSQIFTTIVFGHTLHLVEKENILNPVGFNNYLKEKSIEVFEMTPTLFTQLVLPFNNYEDLELKLINIGGENLSVGLVREFLNKKLPSRLSLINTYGPTECTVDATLHEINRESILDMRAEFVPIGKPLDNVQVYVLDENLSVLPVGVVGELYIGGAGVSDGYLGQIEITRSNFIDNPFASASQREHGYTRLYKTGDQVRWLASGDLEYIGRNDFQVKIRGQRIEIGEIEFSLAKIDGIVEARVIAKETDADKYLVAYVIANANISQEEIRSALTSYLPDHMIPSFFVLLDDFPITGSGKLDAKALPEPDYSDVDLYQPPKTELEAKLCAVWQDVLQLERVGVTDNFFRIGGHSILAIKLSCKLSDALNLSVGVADIFQCRTVSSLAQQLQSHTLELARIVPEKRESYPLSFAQERLWFIELYGEGTNAYHLPMLFEIKPDTDISRLKQAIKTVVQRHEVLRTIFKNTHGNYEQVVTDTDVNISEYHDKSCDLAAQLKHDINEPFDLQLDIPIRVSLYFYENKIDLLINIHHIASDGWSCDILLTEILTLYEGEKLPDLNVQYKDFSVWQRESLHHDALERQLDYWREKLSDYQVLQLPTDRKRPADFDFSGNLVKFSISTDTSNKLRKLSRVHGCTMFTTLLSGFYVLLNQYSAQNDIVVGTPTANRHYPQIQDLLGFFVNSIALRFELDTDCTIEDLILSVQREILDAQKYQEVPFEKVVEALSVQPDTSRHPIFQVMFSLQSFDSDEENKLLKPLPVNGEYEVSKFDLTCFIDDSADEIRGAFGFATALYDKSTIERMVDQYSFILSQIAERSEQKIKELNSVRDDEFKRLVFDWNDTDIDYPSDKTLVDLFEAQVEKTPKYPAIFFKQHCLDYASLNANANKLAQYLLEQAELKPGDLVALCVERSMEMVIAILAILKAGAAYVPIDPNNPIQRIKYILDDTATSLLLTQNHLLEKFSASKDINVISLDSTCYNDYDTSAPGIETEAKNLAYVIYTSGTTGNPKGVMVEHTTVVNRVLHMIKFSEISSSDSYFFKTNYIFDVSVSDIFSHLLAGASVTISENKFLLSEIETVLQSAKVNAIHLVPSQYDLVTDIIDRSELTKIYFSGEKLTQKVLNRVPKHITCFNYYGPTELGEITGLVSNEENVSSIGKVFPCNKAYILDTHNRLVPQGGIGELHVSGVGVARGYLNKPELTSEKFISNHFATPTQIEQGYDRLYKTGDLVRWLDDGEIEYIGRTDFQVKINGYRIELEEIENALMSDSRIKSACVVAKRQNDHQYIAAYIVSDERCSEEFILNRLSTSLPEYMLPKIIVQLDSIPLTSNGKLDRKQLPEPDVLFPKEDIMEQLRGGLEKKLCEVYASILGVSEEEIGTKQSFFRMGGNSISVIKLQHQIKEIKEFSSITIADLFKYNSIQKLVASVGVDSCNDYQIQQDSATNEHEIAIIATSGAFSSVSDVEEFWDLIAKQEEGLAFCSKEECLENGVDELTLSNPNYVPVKGLVDGIDKFDPFFWGMSPNEAKQLDPQIRKLLEHSWFALESAGYSKNRKTNTVGVFVGGDTSDYLQENILTGEASKSLNQWEALVSNSKDALATKVAFYLGLTGPANTVSTACSTSLVGVIEACKNLRLGSCNMALAGGVSLAMPDARIGYVFEEGMILSKDGHCRSFDDEATGTALGSGVGIVLLKRLSDAIKDHDQILGVIKGYATNNDGDRKSGYTAPSVVGQSECIVNAQRMAGVGSDSIDYVECHGTATKLGDPIEIQALKEAFAFNSGSMRSEKECVLGAVKANIGHAGSAAGIAGMIKVCSMLQKSLMPGQANYVKPNTELHLSNSGFEIITKNRPWPSLPGKQRLSAVSSFGVGGTNAHVIISDYTSGSCTGSDEVQNRQKSQDKPYIFSVSAKSRASLEHYKQAFVRYLEQNENSLLPGDLAYTLQERRSTFTFRSAFAASSIRELIAKIESKKEVVKVAHQADKPIVFMFPGYGAQYVNMARGLYDNEMEFRDTVDNCISIANQYIDINLLHILYPEASTSSNESSDAHNINAIQWAQITSFIISYSLAKYLQSLGIKPAAFIGHSTGEYVAATLSDVFSLEDAIKLVITRSQLMSEMPPGSMLSIQALEEEIRPLIEKYRCELSLVNSQQDIVVSGTEADIDSLKSALDRRSIDSLKLKTDHAYHSSDMEEAAHRFAKVFDGMNFQEPKFQNYVSNLTGRWADKDVSKVEYWLKHLRHTVLFDTGVTTLIEHFNQSLYFLEVGAGKNLTSFVKRHLDFHNKEKAQAVQILPSLRELEHRCDPSSKEELQALLWANGLIEKANAEEKFCGFRNIPNLPVYRFDHKRFWLNKRAKRDENSSALSFLPKSQWFRYPSWRSVCNLFQSQQSTPTFESAVFFIRPDQKSLFQTHKLARNTQLVILDQNTNDLNYEENTDIRVNPSSDTAYSMLSSKLFDSRRFQSIVHMASINNSPEIETSLDLGFYSLFMIKLWLLSKHKFDQLVVLTSGLIQITGADDIAPLNGTMVGAVRNIKHEMPDITSLIVDCGGNFDDGVRGLNLILQSEGMIKSEDPFAVKHKKLWKQELSQIERPEASDPIIRDEDSVLITGGMGGVALAVAEHISLYHKVNFILVGRNDVLNKLNPNDYELDKRKTIERIIANGCRVNVKQGDLSDSKFINQLVDDTTVKYGSIDGIIHTAGVMPLLPDQYTLPRVKDVFKAKVYGIHKLLHSVDRNKLRFLANTSSNASLMGDINRFEYCASNSYLDFLCADQPFFKDTRVVTVNWFGWSDVGMVRTEGNNINVDHANVNTFHQLMNANGVNAKDGAEIFYQLINQGSYEQVSVSKLDLEQVRTHLFTIEEESDQAEDAQIKIIEEEYSDLQYIVALSFCEILGVDEISIHDDFVQLGGNSISAIKLSHKLKKRLRSPLTVADIFNYKSIVGISAYMTSNTASSFEIKSQEKEFYPLSFAQERLWFIEQYERGTNAYHIPLIAKLKESASVLKLKELIQRIVQRHSILRTVFEKRNGECVQRILNQALEIRDYKGSDDELDLQLEKDINTPFKLENQPPIRAAFYHFKDSPRLLINIHHIASDGWSSDILLKEIEALYREENLSSLSIQYKDFALWQREYLSGEVLAKQLEYWRTQLKGYETLNLPLDRGRPKRFSYQGDHVPFSMDVELSNNLRSIARQHSCTLNAVLLSGFYVLMHKYSGQEDIVVGTTIANRHYADIQELMGFFVNSLALREQFNPEENVLKLISQVQESLVKAQGYQDIPFEKIVEDLRVEQDPSKHPVFQVTFILQSFGASESSSCFDSITFNSGRALSKFDLSCFTDDSQDAIQGEFNYATALFEKETIERMVRHYLLILRQLSENILTPIANIRMLSETEYQKVIFDWNKTSAPFLRDRTIHQLFEQQAEKTPDLMAVSCEGLQLTYKELNQRSNQLAHYLRKKYKQEEGKALAPDTIIALYLERSVDLIIGMLAILKAGGAYVPIETEYPKDLVEYILKDTHSTFILTSSEYLKQLPSNVYREISICINANCYEQELTVNLPQYSKSTDLAYLIYTSGTTGAPNGVMIEHQGFVCGADSLAKSFGVEEGTVVLQFASNVFDASVLEIFNALVSGAQVDIISEKVKKDVELLLQHLKNRRIASAIIPPSLLTVFPFDELADLRTLIVAGETCTEDVMKRWSKGRNLINAYGPTESTVCATLNPFKEGSRNTNIGKPITNTKTYVLDKHLNPVPIGVVGELYLAGPRITRGYFGNPQLSSEKLIANPFVSAEDSDFSVLYKTGDLVKWLECGSLDYIGRNDFQVKIRGHRIEIGEIENALMSIQEIKQAFVMARTKADERYLIAYILTHSDYVSEEYIQTELSKRIPGYMLPRCITVLREFPLTVNGKIDRKQLPEPDFSLTNAYEPPSTNLEEKVCAIWQEVLEVSQVGIGDNFFDLGGHSILAVKLVHHMNEALSSYEFQISLYDLFAHKTIKSLLSSEPKVNQPNKLVKELNTHEEGRGTFYFIHPGGLGIEAYTELSEKLGTTYNLFGIENYNILNENRVSSINELATIYLDALPSFNATDTIRLCGWSFGGQVAIEMAFLLEQRGFENIKVYSLDSFIFDDKLAEFIDNEDAQEKQQKSTVDSTRGALDYLIKTQNAIEVEKVMAQQSISGFLESSSVTLFKALHAQSDVLDGSPKGEDLNQYVQELKDNGLGQYVNHLEVHEVECHHYSILDYISSCDKCLDVFME